MKLLQKMLNQLNGLYYPQEYLCLAKELVEHPLHAYLVEGNKITRDITNEHLFTGYHPLIITLYSSPGDNMELPPGIDIIFSQQLLLPNDIFKKRMPSPGSLYN